MAVLISKIIQHQHSGDGGPCYKNGPYALAQCPVGGFAHGFWGYAHVGSKCDVCGATLVRIERYDSTCSASKCCTVTVDYENSVLTAQVSASGDDSGMSNVNFKWYYNNIVVGTGSTLMPTVDGTYKLVVTGTDNKTGSGKTAELSFKVEYVNNWEKVYVGNTKIYGMALGDKYVSAAALGDTLLN